MTTGAWGKIHGYRHKYGLTPDWSYYQVAQMTDPFFEYRVEEFLNDYAWSVEIKNKLIRTLLDRYNDLEYVCDEDFIQLQGLGDTCYKFVVKRLDAVENFSNDKENILEHIEMARRLLLEWIV